MCRNLGPQPAGLPSNTCLMCIIAVMSGAKYAEIGGIGGAPEGYRRDVVDLEVVARGATQARLWISVLTLVLGLVHEGGSELGSNIARI